MTGSVIENLSNRKLFYVLLSLFGLQVAFFLVGAWFSPVPTSSMEFEMTKCEDKTKGKNGKWNYIRPEKESCLQIPDLDHFTPSGSFDLREIVFVAQMPHVRDEIQLEYSPWFQFLLGIIQLEVEYNDVFKYEENAKLELEVRLGYKENTPSEWKELVVSNVTRTLSCTIEENKKKAGYNYDCEPLNLFELGHNSYPLYLMNIRIPINQAACSYDPKSPNCQLGKITGMRVVAIHQNGGFTSMWVVLKCIISPFMIGAVYWYWNRISHRSLGPNLLEKSIFALGVSTIILDLPLELFSVYTRFPFVLILADIRQGLFYLVLFSFWLIFAGEHLIGDNTRNNISSYRFNLLFICLTSFCLLLFDICERGLQLADPFHSIWESYWGNIIAYASIYIATFCATIYFVFLFYKIWNVWTSLKANRSSQMYRNHVERRLKVESVIFRFKFLMLFTLVCAAMTIVSYTMKQHGEAQLHSDEPDDSILTHSTSSFFTGVFGMWNIYVLLLLAMYAPSHKIYAGAEELIDESEGLMENEGNDSNVMRELIKTNTD